MKGVYTLTEPDVKDRQIEGLRTTVTNIKDKLSEFQKENNELKEQLGILEKDGYVEPPSLPPIILGEGLYARPVCAKHGAMLAYKHNIYRCPTCLSSVDLTNVSKWTQVILQEKISSLETDTTGIVMSIDSLKAGTQFLFGDHRIKVTDNFIKFERIKDKR